MSDSIGFKALTREMTVDKKIGEPYIVELKSELGLGKIWKAGMVAMLEYKNERGDFFLRKISSGFEQSFGYLHISKIIFW